MKNIRFGSSNLCGSRLAYGCWRLPETVGEEEIKTSNTRPALKVFEAALEAGYTTFDLADVYGQGRAERIFGVLLTQMADVREKIQIITKCGIRPPESGVSYRYDFSKDHILRSCEASLKRMSVDCVDLLLLHRPDYLMQPAEVAEAFDELKSSGKVKEFGVSNFTGSQTRLLQDACSMRLLTNQVEISLCNVGALEDGTLDHCMLERMTPMAWSPLGGGYLLNPQDGNSAAKRPDHIDSLRKQLAGVSEKNGQDPALTAIAWLLRHPSGIVPVIGSLNEKRIGQIARADQFELSREDWYELLQAGMGNRLP